SIVFLITWTVYMTSVYISPVRLFQQLVTTGAFRSRDYVGILSGVGLAGLAAVVVVANILLSRLAVLSAAAPAAVEGLKATKARRSTLETAFGTWAVGNFLVLSALGLAFGTGTIGEVVDRFINFG